MTQEAAAKRPGKVVEETMIDISRPRPWRGLVVLLGTVVILAVGAAASRAADAGDFYKGKTIDLIISTGPGGGLDHNARIVARHLANHIPGKPTIVAKNMPGAGHLRAANFLHTQAAKDGTVIGTVIPGFLMSQVLEGTGVKFDASKFNWLGSTSYSTQTVYVWKTSKVGSVEEARKREVLMGATGAGSYAALYPTVMNNVLGTRFRIIAGYKSSAEVNLAMERGEVEGRAGNNWNSLKAENGEWLKNGSVRLITQIGLERDPEIGDVPLLLDLAKTAEDRDLLRFFSADIVLGRPFLAPPGVPDEIVAVLRKAFADMMADPAFLKESADSGLDIKPVDGAAVQKVVEEIVNAPADIVARAKLAITPKDVVGGAKAEGQTR
jgi:tripartite-type tricarboxylate transporter receptor subunit TctC